MHILVTNDDGVHAPGLSALVQAVRPLGEVTVLAPDRNWSASGHVKTLDRPLRVKETELADGTPAYACDGAPSDCVALPLLGIFPYAIDLVLSGINPNANLGHDVTYSGTVTAAMEAVIGGVPGIAISLDSPVGLRGVPDFRAAAGTARQVTALVIRNGLPEGVLLNVNVPYGPPEQVKGFQLTRQGMRVYRDQLEKRLDPRGRAYFWIGGEAPTGVEEDGTDIGALAAGYVSVTPLHLDLTAHDSSAHFQTWNWQEE